MKNYIQSKMSTLSSFSSLFPNIVKIALNNKLHNTNEKKYQEQGILLNCLWTGESVKMSCRIHLENFIDKKICL